MTSVSSTEGMWTPDMRKGQSMPRFSSFSDERGPIMRLICRWLVGKSAKKRGKDLPAAANNEKLMLIALLHNMAATLTQGALLGEELPIVQKRCLVPAELLQFLEVLNRVCEEIHQKHRGEKSLILELDSALSKRCPSGAIFGHPEGGLRSTCIWSP